MRNPLGPAGGAGGHQQQRRFIDGQRRSGEEARFDRRQRRAEFAQPQPGARGSDDVVLLGRRQFRIYADGDEAGLPGSEQRDEEIQRIGVADDDASTVCKAERGETLRFDADSFGQFGSDKLAPGAGADKPRFRRDAAEERLRRVGRNGRLPGQPPD
jgi:hypothetical protein